MNIYLKIKQLLHRFGYDIRYHHPFYETVIEPLGIITILDIGANSGHYSKEMNARFPKAIIYAFEPLGDCFTELEALAKNIPNIHPLHYALGDENAEQDIERSTFHPSSSLLSMTSLHTTLYPKSAGSTKERITIKRLDDIAPTLSLTAPLLVKIDVQGYEDKVIDGGTETLKKAAAILVETSFFPLYEGQPLFTDIAEKLSRLGFSYYGSYHTHYSKKTGRAMYEDSVFISEDTRKHFETEELKAATARN
jgi:FkbM family methyltransferase